MTDTITVVAEEDEPGPEMPPEPVDQKQLAEQLLAQARAQGVELVGPGGL